MRPGRHEGPGLAQPEAPPYGLESTGGRLVVFGAGVVLRSADGEVAGGFGVSAGTVEQSRQPGGAHMFSGLVQAVDHLRDLLGETVLDVDG